MKKYCLIMLFMIGVLVMNSKSIVVAADYCGQEKRTNVESIKNYTTIKTSKLKTKHRKKKITKKVKKKTIINISYSIEKCETKKTTTITTTTKESYKKRLKTKISKKIISTIITTNYSRPGQPDINNYKNRLPQKIILSFHKDKIKSTIMKLPGEQTGIFSPAKRQIGLKINADYIFIHEIGHYVDYKKGNLSTKTEFKQIYQAEKNKYSTFNGYNNSYSKSNAKEYFAEAFRDYFYSAAARKKLKTNTPKTYNFINKTIKEY